MSTINTGRTADRRTAVSLHRDGSAAREKQNKRRNLKRWRINRTRRLRAISQTDRTPRQRKRLRQLESQLWGQPPNGALKNGADNP